MGPGRRPEESALRYRLRRQGACPGCRKARGEAGAASSWQQEGSPRQRLGPPPTTAPAPSAQEGGFAFHAPSPPSPDFPPARPSPAASHARGQVLSEEREAGSQRIICSQAQRKSNSAATSLSWTLAGDGGPGHSPSDPRGSWALWEPLSSLLPGSLQVPLGEEHPHWGQGSESLHLKTSLPVFTPRCF